MDESKNVKNVINFEYTLCRGVEMGIFKAPVDYSFASTIGILCTIVALHMLLEEYLSYRSIVRPITLDRSRPMIDLATESYLKNAWSIWII